MLSHNVVKDLLPQYIDNLCSDETNTEVREHLDGCYECESIYRAMTEKFTEEDIPTEETDVKDIDYLKKVKARNLRRIIAAACSVAVLAFAFVFIFVIGVPVKSDDISLTMASILKGGNVTAGENHTLQYKSYDHSLMLSMVGEGNFSIREEVSDTPNISVLNSSGNVYIDRTVTLYVNVVPEFLGNGKIYSYSLDKPDMSDFDRVKNFKVVVKTADKEYIASRVLDFNVVYQGEEAIKISGDGSAINLAETVQYNIIEIDTKDND
jgi:hypothetical protein